MGDRKICCLPASPRIFEHLKKMVYMLIFNGIFTQKGHLEFSGAFFLAEVFEKVGSAPKNFSRIFQGQIVIFKD